MKGLVVVGYPGIGKSACGGKNGCIDLESSCFYVGDDRSPDWYVPYCQTALHLANQGYVVFVSTHQVVRDFLLTVPLPENVANVVSFCPRVSMKDEWLKRLKNRFESTNLYKDKLAYERALKHYESDIIDIFDNSRGTVYQPDSIDYDLMDYVDLMRIRWCESDEDVKYQTEKNKLLNKYEEFGSPEDIEFSLRTYSSLLCELTNNKLSKTKYTLDAILSVIDDCRSDQESFESESQNTKKAKRVNRTYQRRLNLHQCVRCGAQLDNNYPYVLCPSCRDKNREASKSYYKYFRENQLCCSCGKPVSNGKSRCEICMSKASTSRKALYRRNKLNHT